MIKHNSQVVMCVDNLYGAASTLEKHITTMKRVYLWWQDKTGEDLGRWLQWLDALWREASQA